MFFILPKLNVKNEAITLALFFLAVISLALLPAASAQNPSIEDGKTIFQTKCSGCHTIGGGDLVGPDLRNVTNIRDHSWLVNWISAPDKMLAEGDPTAKQLLQQYTITMPNLGLSQQQIEDVIAYIANQSKAPPGKTPTESGQEGNPSTGQALFVGNIRLKNGGPPCQSCHNVEGISFLGGGRLGPDLTKVYDRYGDKGLSAVLATIPFPTMQPIFGIHPLTTQEQADLKAFFKEAAARPVQQGGIDVTIMAAIGYLIAILLIGIIWRRRLISVRKMMVQNTITEMKTEKEGAKR